MEKLNIAEILKDCPKGMELDCTMYDKVTLIEVDNSKQVFPITVSREDGYTIVLTKYGQYTNTTFAVRLYHFVEQVDVCDMASEEEKDYLLRVAKKLYDYQVATATQKEEVDYLERVKL